jgi:hypothetical protein
MITDARLLRWLIDVTACLLLLQPLLVLTRAGYDRETWWRRSETDIFPFPTPWIIRVPVALWYLAFWAVALWALISDLSRGRAAWLGLTVGLVEVAYGLLQRGRRMRPLSAEAQPAVVAFALGHNALTEEVLFRGAPLWIAAAGGFSDVVTWQVAFVPLSGLAFGLYHRLVGRASRVPDTTVFGCLLGAVAVWYGVSSAVVVHIIHNALAIPFGQTDGSMQRWQRMRLLYVISLFAIAVARLSLSWWPPAEHPSQVTMQPRQE